MYWMYRKDSVIYNLEDEAQAVDRADAYPSRIVFEAELTTEQPQFQHVGWQIHGGLMDGLFLTLADHATFAANMSYDSFSPIYLEVGTDG